MLSRVPEGSVDTVLSYCHYCLNDATLGDLLPDFQRRGLGVINASPLSMGLLTPQGPPEWHPAPSELQAAVREAAAWCEARSLDLPRLAIQWAVREEAIATTLVGMCTPEQVATNVKTVVEALAGNGMGAEEEKELLGLLGGVHGVTWASGRPENAEPR